jgi:hypothetical protein
MMSPAHRVRGKICVPLVQFLKRGGLVGKKFLAQRGAMIPLRAAEIPPEADGAHGTLPRGEPRP